MNLQNETNEQREARWAAAATKFKSPPETKEQKIARLEAAGIIVQDCSGCRYWYEHPTASPMAPSHNASSRCRSGQRNHCTCDTCF